MRWDFTSKEILRKGNEAETRYTWVVESDVWVLARRS